MSSQYNKLYEEPAYGLPEAAVYLKVPYQTLHKLERRFGKRLDHRSCSKPSRFAFPLNLLNAKSPAACWKIYDRSLKVRAAWLQNSSRISALIR